MRDCRHPLHCRSALPSGTTVSHYRPLYRPHYRPLYRHPDFFAEKHQDPARLRSRACVEIKVSTIGNNTHHPTQGIHLQ